MEDEEKEDEAEKDDDEQEEQDEKDDEDDKDKDGDDEESEETFAAIECQTICSICIFTCPRNMAMPKFDETPGCQSACQLLAGVSIHKPPLFVMISHGVLWMEETLPEDEAKTDIADASEDMGVKTESVL